MENSDFPQCSIDVPLPTPSLLSSSEPPTLDFTDWTEEHLNELDYIVSQMPGKTAEQLFQQASTYFSILEPVLQKKSRRPPIPWTVQEHRLFLMGLEEYGKGDWKNISRFFVKTKDASQVASHAQKYFMRRDHPGNYSGRKSSILDIHTINQSIEPRSRRNQNYKPIAPSPLPPSSPIFQPRIDYNLLQGSRTRNKYRPSNLFPMETCSYPTDPANMHNFPSSSTYSLDEQCSSSQPFDPFQFANTM